MYATITAALFVVLFAGVGAVRAEAGADGAVATVEANGATPNASPIKKRRGGHPRLGNVNETLGGSKLTDSRGSAVVDGTGAQAGAIDRSTALTSEIDQTAD
jgi:hypothetical protein